VEHNSWAVGSDLSFSSKGETVRRERVSSAPEGRGGISPGTVDVQFKSSGRSSNWPPFRGYQSRGGSGEGREKKRLMRDLAPAKTGFEKDNEDKEKLKLVQ